MDKERKKKTGTANKNILQFIAEIGSFSFNFETTTERERESERLHLLQMNAICSTFVPFIFFSFLPTLYE